MIIYFNYIINYKHARIEFYIDFKDKQMNKRYFDKFIQFKDELENKVGETLVWDRLDENRASIIRQMIDDDGLKDKNRWPELQDKMIQAMIKFQQTFKPYINKFDPT